MRKITDWTLTLNNGQCRGTGVFKKIDRGRSVSGYDEWTPEIDNKII